MLLIGSKALQEYIPDLGRVTHDWDFLMSTEEVKTFDITYSKYLIKSVKNVRLYEIPNLGIVEISDESGWTFSDNLLILNNKNNMVHTPFGMSYIPSLEDLYEIKKATYEFINEPKHLHDLILMEGPQFSLLKVETELYRIRRNEIKERLEKETKVKYDFFHKFHIPEYIKHDYLHEIIADLVNIKLPTYQRITTAETDIAESLFNNLTHDQKITLMVEESLVLSLERWFLPQMIENGINFKLLEIFDNNNEGLPTYQILKHCCVTGLKGEAEYITNFSRNNFFEIEKVWIHYKKIIKEKGGFSSELYDMIFKLREDYKKGIKVGIT